MYCFRILVFLKKLIIFEESESIFEPRYLDGYPKSKYLKGINLDLDIKSTV